MNTAAKPWIDPHETEANRFADRAKGTVNDNYSDFPWTHYPPVYSNVLIRAVLGCLAFHPQRDPAGCRAHRMSLFELRDIIGRNLNRLDAFEAAQNNTNHPLHVHVPAEDAHYRLSGLFPLSEPTIDDFVEPRVSETDQETARIFFRDYQNSAHATTVPEDNRTSQLPRPSMMAMEKDINDTHAAVHQKNVAEAHGAERNSKILALDHAMTTIKKYLNPGGTFKQHTEERTRVFSPRDRSYLMSIP
jgi:hypothetical protein